MIFLVLKALIARGFYLEFYAFLVQSILLSGVRTCEWLKDNFEQGTDR